MQPNIISKLPKVEETIFTVMSSLANKHNAINLGQGFPDFQMNEELTDLVTSAMKDGYNQYTHMNGFLPLREVLAEKVEYLYASKIDAEKEITITPGGTYAIYTALTTVLNPGDEVLVFEPAYDCYIPAIEMNGAVAVPIPLSFPDYKIDWQLTRQKVSERTKLIMINSPHNPTGSVLSEHDIKELRSLVNDTPIFILSDEVYEHLIFDNEKHQSILKYPELFARSFVCFSFGKVFHCTGWKLGYCIAPAAIMNEFRKIHQFNAFTCNTPMQHAISIFIQNRDSYLSLGSFMQKKRDFFQELMNQTKFTALPTHGSYFQLYSYEKISDQNDLEVAKLLTINNGVATIPVSAFYGNRTDNKVLRFCFCKKPETIEGAVERLIKL